MLHLIAVSLHFHRRKCQLSGSLWGLACWITANWPLAFTFEVGKRVLKMGDDWSVFSALVAHGPYFRYHIAQIHVEMPHGRAFVVVRAGNREQYLWTPIRSMDLGTPGKRKGRDPRGEEDDEEDDPLMAALEGISIMDNQGGSLSISACAPSLFYFH